MTILLGSVPDVHPSTAEEPFVSNERLWVRTGTGLDVPILQTLGGRQQRANRIQRSVGFQVDINARAWSYEINAIAQVLLDGAKDLSIPWQLGFRNYCNVQFVVPSPNANPSRVATGIFSFLTVNPFQIVGVYFLAEDDQTTWRCVVSDSADSVNENRVLDVLTTVAFNVNNDLEFVVDGTDQSVTFFINNVQVARQVFTGTALGRTGGATGQAVRHMVWTDDTQGGGGPTAEFYYDIDGVPNVLELGFTEATTAPPVVSTRLTYQRILNMARLRAPEFRDLVIDDQMVMDELNALTLDLIQEGSDADHAAFQELLTWSTDVLPGLPVTTPPIADLGDTDRIVVPTWVNSIYAAQAVRSNGNKVKIDVLRREVDIRERSIDSDTFLLDLRDPRLQRPVAFRIWSPAESRWELIKDTTSSSGVTAWDDITDAELIVSGVRIPMSVRADLTDPIPVPFQAMRPLIEAYALILGGRAGKDIAWMREQRSAVEQTWTRFREFVNLQDMSDDEPYDPEIGQP